MATKPNSVIAQVFVTPDGVQHSSLADANAHLGKPKVIEALTAIAGGKVNVAEWLLSVKEQLLEIFDVGVIHRVTKAEQKALTADLTALKAAAEEQKAKGLPVVYPFLFEHADSILESFHHPKVTKMKPEERDSAIQNSLMALSDGSQEMVDWIKINYAAIFEAYKAAVPKRTPAPQAMAALRDYQAKEKAKKEALLAAAAGGTGVAAALPEVTGTETVGTVVFPEDTTSDLSDLEEVEGLGEDDEADETEDTVLVENDVDFASEDQS